MTSYIKITTQELRLLITRGAEIMPGIIREYFGYAGI